MIGENDMDIIIANLFFWPLWYLVSNIPFVVNQYIINNHAKVTIWKKQPF